MSSIQHEQLEEFSQRQTEQLQGLIDAGIAISSERTLDAVLQRLVDLARPLLNARYAALGVMNPENPQILDKFIFSGIDERARERMGGVPGQHGLLGALLKDEKPIRLANLTADPRATGTPAYHPVMHSFLGVPIKLHERVFGNLYVTQKIDATEFSETDERIAVTLAAQAAVAIENARLYEETLRSHAFANERAEQMRTIINTMREPLWVIDASGSIIRANRAAAHMLGVDEELATGMSAQEWSERLHIRNADGRLLNLAGSMLAAPLHGEPLERIEVRVKGDGESRDRWLSISGAPFGDGRAVYVARDITSRKEVEQLKANFLSTITHELRTPLTSIKGFVNSLSQEDVEWDEETKRAFIDGIAASADQLNLLVNNLLDMSRIEAGRMKLDLELIYPLDLVQNAVHRLAGILRDNPLILELPEDLPPFMGDYQQIERVLNNLIVNAVKYSMPGKRIWLSVAADPEQHTIAFTVRDEGLGIAPEDQLHIFESFYRGRAAARRTPGTGLGLAISKAIVDMHRGYITLESTPGLGSTFRVTLPLDGPSGSEGG